MTRLRRQTSILVAFVALATMLVLLCEPVTSGSLEPSAPPGSTMHTLDEIYTKVESLSSPNGDSLPATPPFGEIFAIHMTVEGTAQGNIEGSITAKGLEGTIPVVTFEHSVHIPTDPQSGLPTGKRVHHPLIVTKYIDKSSPKLFQALVTGETCSVILRYYETGSTGAAEHYFTIELQNAKLLEIRAFAPNYEQVSFTYQKIIWTWEKDGISTEDDWGSPSA